MKTSIYSTGKNPNSHPIGRRKYTVNDNFFEKPNIINSYYAGFIAADGCISEQKFSTWTTNRLYIAIHKKDRIFLENFKKDISFSGPISEYNDSFVKIVINSNKIAQDLKKIFNITPRKTFSLMPPNLTDINHIKAFIIGYIDGDGSIYFSEDKVNNKQKKISISSVGTYDFLKWMLEHFNAISSKNHKTAPQISKGGYKRIHENKNKVYVINISDKWAREVFTELYTIQVPKFERKWKHEFYEYCVSYKKHLPIKRRKGVNVFDLNGNFLKHCDTLLEAEALTKVHFSRISSLCKINDNKHMANGYMFSRDKTKMESYIPINPYAAKHLYDIKNHMEAAAHDAGEVDMEESESTETNE